MCVKRSNGVSYLFIQFQILEHARYNNWFPGFFFFGKSLKRRKWMFLFEVKRLIWSALDIELYFLQPVLGGHLTLARGWPLNTGSTIAVMGKKMRLIAHKALTSLIYWHLLHCLSSIKSLEAFSIITLMTIENRTLWLARSFALSRYNHLAVIIALKANSFQNGSQIFWCFGVGDWSVILLSRIINVVILKQLVASGDVNIGE